MLFGLINLLLSDSSAFFKALPLVLLTIVLSLLVAITIHEFGHAAVANLLGDRTARNMGRVSLNPLKHLDPVGTLFLVLVGFGWGKPVPVNPYALKKARRDMALVALAGPAANIILALVVGFALRGGEFRWFLIQPFFSIDALSVTGLISLMLSTMVYYNILLGLFNLIPIAPLDGSKVLIGLLPETEAEAVARIEPYGPAIIMVIFMFDVLRSGPGIFGTILRPFIQFFVWISTGVKPF